MVAADLFLVDRYTPAPLSESIKPDDDAFSNYCPPPGTPPAAVSDGLERCNFG